MLDTVDEGYSLRASVRAAHDKVAVPLAVHVRPFLDSPVREALNPAAVLLAVLEEARVLVFFVVVVPHVAAGMSGQLLPALGPFRLGRATRLDPRRPQLARLRTALLSVNVKGGSYNLLLDY